MSNITVITPKCSKPLNIVLWPTTEIHLMDVALFLKSILNIEGYPSVPITSHFNPNCLNLVIGVVGYGRHNMEILPGSIIIQMEQLYDESMWLASPWYLGVLSNPQYKVVDYNFHNQKYLQKKANRTVPVMKIAWTPEIKTINPVPTNNKDIDILFYGGVNQRRANFLNKINELGKRLVVRNNDLREPERTHLIQRSKIVLNFHYYDVGLFEWPRVHHLLMNGAFVISEDSVNKDEYKDYCSVIFTRFNDPNDMAKTIASYLEHPDIIDGMAKEAHEKLKKERSTFPSETLQT